MIRLLRAFIAVDLSDELRDKVADIQSMFSDFKFKFVDPNIVHITMKFLGDVHEENIDEIAKALDSIEYDHFEANVKGIGVFPKPKYAKVIWVGCEGGFEGLHALIEDSLTSFDITPDMHKFNAHATLARVKYLPKKQKQDLIVLLDELKEVDLGTMQVTSIKLKKSILTPEGPVYETLHEVKLK
ncbi:RNA 2',3'-cyclic phosphodiesterase [Methanolobus sp. ZRKC3]|uniref:RNA 2',3'-cyclic phosphodiesterase n=1 Tax=Methanolobus sp. ZRKC3 TaxID=3125786 RepID=UPI0032479822